MRKDFFAKISVLPISTRSVREDVRISAPRCKGGLGYGEGFLEGFQKTRFQSYLVGCEGCEGGNPERMLGVLLGMLKK